MIGHHTYGLYGSPSGLGYPRQFAPRHGTTASPVLPLEVLVDLAAHGMEFSVNSIVDPIVGSLYHWAAKAYRAPENLT
ncbi:MAG: hypothetical protein H6626_12930 [Pseudobdellovibrionaceae bacterium]|nr:hypothetical protein [Bdellovibrionales bacterium]USN47078.1 MAG: hypothetical protein H6626_12930 [Pseudobdellovibrionaceae bacterium]